MRTKQQYIDGLKKMRE